MRMEMDQQIPDCMVVSHGQESLRFDVSNYNRANLGRTDETAPTHYMNLYLSTLPLTQQDRIFQIYCEISSIFSRYLSTIGLRQELTPLVKKLYSEIDLAVLERWVFRENDIIVPPNKFGDQYVHSDEVPFSREQTYTSPDYANLVALALSFRMMIPIWGEFIRQTEGETKSKFKELHAFKLLVTSHVYDCAAMRKLKTYIESNIKTNDSNILNIVINGVGLEDYPLLILSSVVVKRLAVGNIQGSEPNTNLVVTIHNDILARNSGNNGGGLGESWQKKTFDTDGNDDTGISRQENFRIREERPAGVVATRKIYVEKYLLNMAKRLDPTITQEELDEYVERAKEMHHHQIKLGQIRLIQLVVGHILEPESFDDLYATQISRLAGLSQLHLWKRGHHKLAVLVTATAVDNNRQSAVGSIARIPKEQMELLEKYWPYNRISAKRKNTTPKNQAVDAIDLITSHLSAGDWILNCTKEQAELVTGVKNTRRYYCPADIKILLAKLAIEQVEIQRDLYLKKKSIAQ